jgi:hypothetical protein
MANGGESNEIMYQPKRNQWRNISQLMAKASMKMAASIMLMKAAKK